LIIEIPDLVQYSIIHLSIDWKTLFSKARDLSGAMLAYTELPDELRALEPPDPIPNSAVKRRIADGSVVFRHVRVGHRQAFI